MKAPQTTLRFESKKQADLIKQAAKLEKRSVNQFVILAAEAAAKAKVQTQEVTQ